MCVPASMIATKDKIFWSKTSESHTDIIEEFGLRERNARGEYLFVPIEITPPMGANYIFPLDYWIYATDVVGYERDCLPKWYDEKKVERRARAALKDWYKQKVVGPNEIREIKDEQVICYGNVVAKGKSKVSAHKGGVVEAYHDTRIKSHGGSFIKAYGFCKVEVWGNNIVEANNDVAVESHGGSVVMAWGNSTVVAREHTAVNAYDDSAVLAYDESTVSAHNESEVRAYDYSTVLAHGRAKVSAFDFSTVINYSKKTKCERSQKARLLDVRKNRKAKKKS